MEYPKLTNNEIKRYASLKQKKYRRQLGMFIADGNHLVDEAVKSGWQIDRVVVKPEAVETIDSLNIQRNLVALANSQNFAKIAPSKTPQGVLAIVDTPKAENIILGIVKSARRLIACDNIADPGNLGTIIRTAVAFEYDAVILIGNCAEPYNPKTVTATQGGIFRIPVVEITDISDFLTIFGRIFKIVALSGNYSAPLSDSPKIPKPLIVVGGETHGISPEIEKTANYKYHIEQSSRIDSLNAAIAAAIAMYKFC